MFEQPLSVNGSYNFRGCIQPWDSPEGDGNFSQKKKKKEKKKLMEEIDTNFA